jgi:glycosyltransferase involved in cell wall biosynthesis
VPQPFHTTTIGSLKHGWAISKAYYKTIHKGDAIFIREMIPFVFVAYFWAILFKKHPCHWIVGNPFAILKTQSRSGWLIDKLSVLYAWQDRICTKLGNRLTNGKFICNGQEVGSIYESKRTTVVVSSTITNDEIFKREDTCRDNIIKILLVSFVRPEKGVEYLLKAAGKLKLDKPWQLTIIGSWDRFPDYKSKLDTIINRLNIKDRIFWAGYIAYGPEMLEHFRSSDIFVLPTLSEGTPRVLIEARANSLPCIATNVGGIPSSVHDGLNGLLVEPKNPDALAMAIERIVCDDQLRRSIIKNGLDFATQNTIEKFINIVRHNLR